MFIRAHIQFKLENQDILVSDRFVSTYGVGELESDKFDPMEHFSKRVIVSIRPSNSGNLHMKVRAHLTREFSVHGSFFGLKFELDQQEQKRLTEWIVSAGENPPQFHRDYSRIPNLSQLPIFPVRALLSPFACDLALREIIEFPIIMDVANFNSSGALLFTENQISLSLKPGHQFDLIFQPRGTLATQVKIGAEARWIKDEMNLTNGNLVRSIGVQFRPLEQKYQGAFTELLRAILDSLQFHFSERN